MRKAVFQMSDARHVLSYSYSYAFLRFSGGACAYFFFSDFRPESFVIATENDLYFVSLFMVAAPLCTPTVAPAAGSPR